MLIKRGICIHNSLSTLYLSWQKQQVKREKEREKVGSFLKEGWGFLNEKLLRWLSPPFSLFCALLGIIKIILYWSQRPFIQRADRERKPAPPPSEFYQCQRCRRIKKERPYQTKTSTNDTKGIHRITPNEVGCLWSTNDNTCSSPDSKLDYHFILQRSSSPFPTAPTGALWQLLSPPATKQVLIICLVSAVQHVVDNADAVLR